MACRPYGFFDNTKGKLCSSVCCWWGVALRWSSGLEGGVEEGKEGTAES